MALVSNFTVENKKQSVAHAVNLVFAYGPFRVRLNILVLPLAMGIAMETVLFPKT